MQKKRPEEKPRTHTIEKSPLFRIPTLGALCRILKVKSPASFLDLEFQLKNNPNLYYLVERRGKRDIQAPGGVLKAIQSRLFRILARIEVPAYLVSGKKGLSYVDNAKVHQRNGLFMLSLDIKKFFSSCRRHRILQFFLYRLQTASDIANLLANLCCYQGMRLPLGSPVSQVLSFLAYESMFNTLADFASRLGLTFTVYIDDLCFSSQNRIPLDLHWEVNKILNSYGLRIHWKKIQYRPCGQPKEITGCVVTGSQELKAPCSLKTKTVAAVHRFKNVEETEAAGLTALGLINAVRQIVPDAFEQSRIQIRSRLKKLREAGGKAQ